MKNRHAFTGFTLIELLTVIAVISALAAIIFPVFASVRAKARQTVCVSNMRQIGTAIAMYAQDYDDFYPNAADPSDLDTSIWNGVPYAANVKSLPLLQDVLQPYVNNNQLWCCPSDTGFDNLDMAYLPADPNGVPLNARPTMFKAFGTSYLYRTELALKHKSYSVGCKSLIPPYTDSGPADLNVLMDGNGGWHGTPTPLSLGLNDARRYNVLMGDGHITYVKASVLNDIWACTLD